MIGLLMTNKWAQGVALALALMAGLWGYGQYRYAAGSKAALAEVALVAAAEQERQVAANLAAQRDAEAALNRLAVERDALQALLKENALAADNDPDAGRCGLGAGSLRRLDAIR